MKPVRDDARVSSATVLVRAATFAYLPDAAQIIADHRGEKSSDWVERFSLNLVDLRIGGLPWTPRFSELH